MSTRAVPAFRAGLMSVTMRHLSIEQIADTAVAAGLAAVGWSGDVHVRPGVPDEAARARAACRNAGLAIEGYSSYWRGDGTDLLALFAAASQLGAGRIRVWAGTAGSHTVAADDRAGLVARLAAAADHAAGLGIELVLEFHRNTLTDTLPSSLRLLDEVAHARLRPEPPMATYWQPRPGVSTDDACLEVARLGTHLRGIHVFTWDEERTRFPLAAGETFWRTVLDVAARTPSSRPLDLMLEFVRADDREDLIADAATLHGWLADGLRTD